MHRRLFLALLIITSPPLMAQSHAPSPPSNPRASLATMRNHFRPVVLFAPPGDPRMQQQMTLLTSERAGLLDRQILLVPFDTLYAAAVDPQIIALLPQEEASLRRRFHVGHAEFALILIGKDGGEKLRADAPIAARQLFATIDAMPMRRSEMKPRPTEP